MKIKDFCTGIQHIGVPTNDIKKTIAFYEQLGFHVALRTNNKDEDVAFLQMHNLVIETYENKSAVMEAGAIDHIALDVKDIDALYEVLKLHQFHLLDNQVNSLPFWEHGVKFFTIQGPNNEKIEFCERL
ncbi:VOC family protein [uncultured Bacteroides sp.]|uniref:VOC family protein n=1 Tax=uncultured Bacteroides sp. TaxID=162156 RepID=UPI002632ABE6|nr:VOC family protein [uncultured Bacteroides sp.]